jgi:hypothetical protein
MENPQENLQILVLKIGYKNSRSIIKKLIKKDKIVLVGSSMGAWIGDYVN